LHEEAQALLAQGEYAEARDRLNQLLQRRPDFISAINNLSLIALAEGQVEEAIETARRALERDENNFHALANLIRFLVLRGRSDEARVYVEQLKAIEAQGPEVCLKQIEALSFLGDDRGALDVFRKVEQSGWKLSARDAAFIHHLAAVATMRSGDEDEAKRLWKRALESAPGFELASSNLRDLDKPVSERHAPWPFNLGEWVPRTAIEDLSEQVRNIHPGGEEAVMRAGRRFIEQHPEMNTLIPILLERGDPVGREFGVRAAMIAQTPETLAALRDFALGQRGPDQMRLQASQTAVKHGALDAGLNRLWLDGEWREILLMGFEISGEPKVEMSPRVKRIVGRALDAIHNGDGVEGERLIRQALEIEPDNPTLFNNLTKAYELQGRQQEAEELVYETHRRFPDYLFGRTNLAMLLIADGDPETAEELLKPLFLRREMHYSEFAAFAAAQIELALAERNRKRARSWFELWEQVNPDNPNLELFRSRVTSVRRLLSGFR
jgi:Flp pilus assembly protein TadD